MNLAILQEKSVPFWLDDTRATLAAISMLQCFSMSCVRADTEEVANIKVTSTFVAREYSM